MGVTKIKGMKVAFLRATEHGGNMAGIPLLQTSSNGSLGTSSTLPQDVHVLGPGSSHSTYCKTAQSLCFPFLDPAGNSYEGTSMFREWTLPFVYSPTANTSNLCINTSDSNPGKYIAFLCLLLGKKDVCT